MKPEDLRKYREAEEPEMVDMVEGARGNVTVVLLILGTVFLCGVGTALLTIDLLVVHLGVLP